MTTRTEAEDFAQLLRERFRKAQIIKRSQSELDFLQTWSMVSVRTVLTHS